MTAEPENLSEQEISYEGDAPMSGWGIFAGMMVFGVSVFAFMSMCIGWGVPNMLNYTAFGLTVDWLWYGIFDGLTAIVAFLTAGAIWQGRKIGYYLGLVIATLSAGRWFLFIPAVPFWGATMLVVWILTVYGLTRDRNSFT